MSPQWTIKVTPSIETSTASPEIIVRASCEIIVTWNNLNGKSDPKSRLTGIWSFSKSIQL